MVYSDSGLLEVELAIPDSIYAERFSESEMGHRLELWQVLCRHWWPRYFPADARTLDLGAGYCEFINSIPAREKHALDKNPELRRHARPEVRCVVADFVTGLRQFGEGSLDRIMASNVFEHLADRDTLFQCLAESFRVLAPGGKIVIMQPNIAAVKEKFYDFADHFLPLTDKGMAEAVHASGFEVEEARARFLPYTTKSRYPKWRCLVRLYLLFPPAHRLLGAQMLIVGRKPAAAPAK